MKKLLSVLLAAAMLLGVMALTVSAEGEEKSFDVITEVFAYGQDVTALVVDMGEVSVDAETVSDKTFDVTAANYRIGGAEAFNGARTITDVYVNSTGQLGDREESGRYIVVELEHGFGVPGATTHYYTNRNHYLDMNYTLTQKRTIGAVMYAYSQGETRNLIVDDFELITYDEMILRVYIPENAENLPVVIWNHGAGETYATVDESNNEGMQIVANMGGTGWIRNAPEQAIVIAPQRGAGTGYAEEKVIAYINGLAEDGKADLSRVYVSGCSAGGAETLNFLKNYPTYFAAAIPICAAGSMTEEQLQAIVELPVTFVHSVNDPAVNVSRTRATVEAFAALDPYDLNYNEYPNVTGSDGFVYPNGHWSWIMVLDNDANIMDWLFAQKKGTKQADLITEVFAYGQDVTGIVIDTYDTVPAAGLSTELFTVSAVNYRTNGTAAYEGPRAVTAVYVNNTGEYGVAEESGRYIVIELEHGFYVAGATTHYYIGRNYYLDLNYTITQTAPINDKLYSPRQNVTKNLLYDDFELLNFDGMKIRAYIPEDADNLPVVLWNHGGGEYLGVSNGVDNEGVQLAANMGGIGWLRNGPEEAIVLAPQRGDGTGYTQEKVLAFIDALAAEGKADLNRVYVLGCSAGGAETLSYLRNYPDNFAAAIPICPAGTMTTEQLQAIADMPITFVHAANDGVINVSVSRNMVSAFERLDPYELRYREYPNATGADGVTYPNGHWSWIMVLDNDDGIMEWMFAQRKAEVIDFTDAVIEDGAITITVNARKDIVGFLLANEAGKSITIKEIDKVSESNGRAVWTVKTAIGTAGSRSLSLTPVSRLNGKLPAEKLDIEVTAADYTEDVIAAEFVVQGAKVNTPVGLDVTTGKRLTKVDILNENGMKMGKTLLARSVGEDSIATWEYSMKIGTPGDRVITAMAPNGTSASASITIVK